MKKEQAEELLKKYREGRCSEDEIRLLEQWYNHLLYEAKEPEQEPDLSYWKSEIGRKLPLSPPVIKLPAVWVAAASVILVFAATFYFFKIQYREQSNQVAVSADISPGQNTAVLTLANGSKVVLSDTTSGELAKQAGITVSRSADGGLVYTASEAAGMPDEELAYNTITTPRGGQYEVRLNDGTRVWLNASSSLKFPVRFLPGQRKVELTGEAYFEVAKMSSPSSFIVTTDRQQVEVLGTHFNVSAYKDEPDVKTTLLEGSVRVASLKETNGRMVTGMQQLLQPGQQSVLNSAGLTVKEKDNEGAIGWRDNMFVFNNQPLDEIMRQISRWYNADIRFENNELRNITFSGVVSRLDNVSKVLRRLELTREVSFTVSDRSILVKQPDHASR